MPYLPNLPLQERCCLTRKLDTLKCQNIYDANVRMLHPTDNTCKADLVLKVIDSGKTQAYIPLHRELIKQNIPYFQGLLREESSFRESHAAVIELKFPKDPELLCTYLASVYTSYIDLTPATMIDYHWIADYFNDEEALQKVTTYIQNHIYNDNVLKIWNIGPAFEESCVGYIAKGITIPRGFADSVSEMPCSKLLRFVQCTSKFLQPDVIILLLTRWLTSHYSTENLTYILNGIDFSKIPVGHRFSLYNDVILKIHPKISAAVMKRMHSSLFDGKTESFTKATEERLLNMLTSLKPTPNMIEEMTKLDLEDFATKSAVLKYRKHLRMEAHELLQIKHNNSVYPTTLFHKSRTLGPDVSITASGGCTLTTIPVLRYKWDRVEWTIDIRNGSTTDNGKNVLLGIMPAPRNEDTAEPSLKLIKQIGTIYIERHNGASRYGKRIKLDEVENGPTCNGEKDKTLIVDDDGEFYRKSTADIMLDYTNNLLKVRYNADSDYDATVNIDRSKSYCLALSGGKKEDHHLKFTITSYRVRPIGCLRMLNVPIGKNVSKTKN